ncbi:MAG: sulfotransferase [Chitinophagaceae bacterium]|nr:sulfotransferase [Chitinophagaceae bacterium]
MHSKILIIAGMHRSGTSLVTQWLYRCGLFIGEELLTANIGNMDGHFEDKDFLHLHERFLKERKMPDTGFTDKIIPPLTIAEKELLERMIEKKNNTNKEWGWKEPRTCLFLDVYHELIPSAYYLFVVRDFNTTVNSMLTREYKLYIKKIQGKRGLSKLKWMLFKRKSMEGLYREKAEYFLKIWINYYEHILYHVRLLSQSKFMIVHYSYMLQNSGYAFARLKNDWRFSLNYIPFSAVYKKDLLSEVKDISPWIRDLSLMKKARATEQAIQELFEESVKVGIPAGPDQLTGTA